MEIPYFWFFRWGFRSLVATTGTQVVEGEAAQESGVEGYMGYLGRQGFVPFSASKVLVEDLRPMITNLIHPIPTHI